MVAFVASKSLDIRTALAGSDEEILNTVASPTLFSDETASGIGYFRGFGFTYDSEERFTGGTVQEVQGDTFGSIQFLLTGASYDAVAFEDFYDDVTDSLDLEGLLGFYFAGNDVITGSTGNDWLGGWAGNDSISGGAGADTMLGGAGSDTYIVDNLGDKVYETTTVGGTTNAGGTDTVRSGVSYTLASFVEKLVLTGSAAINGTGNSLANGLTGNAAPNTLNGAAGADTMLGGAGTDTYYVDNLGDKVYETTTTTSTTNAGGTDKVISSVYFSLSAYAGVSFVENLTLTGASAINGTGNALSNTLVGNSAANVLRGANGNDVLAGGDSGGADTLYGDAGNDLLRGGAGNDVLYGGSGNDLFRFDTALSTATVKNVDQIKDFNPAQDTIQLENTIFTKLGATKTGLINPAHFRANTTGLAQDSNDYLIYETDTGKLFYDSNGSAAGGSFQIALLQASLALTSADYFLI